MLIRGSRKALQVKSFNSLIVEVVGLFNSLVKGIGYTLLHHLESYVRFKVR